MHGRHLGIAQGRQQRGQARDNKGNENAGPGHLHAHPGNDKNPGADDLGHADDHQIKAAEAAGQDHLAAAGRFVGGVKIFFVDQPLPCLDFHRHPLTSLPDDEPGAQQHEHGSG